MSKISVIIVEDEISTLEYLESVVEDFGMEVLGTYQHYEKALKAINTRNPDIALLDIDLGGEQTGIQLASQVTSLSSIIFITSFTDKEVLDEAMKVNPAAYLTKPFKDEDVRIAIEMAVFKEKQLSDTESEPLSILNDSLFVRSKNQYVRLRFKEIRWLKAEGAYTTIQTSSTKYVVRNILKKVANQLPDSVFVRVHRSYLVNVDAIKSIGTQSVFIDDIEVPISRSIQNELLGKINLLSSSD